MEKLKKIFTILALVLVTSSTSHADKKSFPFLSLLLSEKQVTKATLKEEVVLITEDDVEQITDVSQDIEDNTLLQITGPLANSLSVGSIIYIASGADNRFPLGFTGRIISINSGIARSGISGETLQCSTEPATFYEIFDEYKYNINDLQLDATNLTGVIMPENVKASSAAPAMLARIATNNQYYKSFKDGAVIVREYKPSQLTAKLSEDIISGKTVELNLEIDFADFDQEAKTDFFLGGEASGKFIITGKMDNIKITNGSDFNAIDGLKALDLHMKGDLEFDARFEGTADVTFGYFSRAWDEVKDSKFSLLGQKAEISGLSVDRKQGKYPLAGLVWSIPCPNGCITSAGQNQTGIRLAKDFGVILWFYYNLKGELFVEGESGEDAVISLVRLEPSELKLGIQKKKGGNLDVAKSLTKKSYSGRLLTAPDISGSTRFDLMHGITTELDFLAGGIYIANAGIDLTAKTSISTNGNINYGTDSIGSPWSWAGDGCFKYSIGAGLIYRGAASFGIEIDCTWDAFDTEKYWSYSMQHPSQDELDDENFEGSDLWYTIANDSWCMKTPIPFNPVTSASGQTWMDRNLGASRIAESLDDWLAYGDLYQWGRIYDGHEKRNSYPISGIYDTDFPGHDSFIIVSNATSDWRIPQNNDLWQGTEGVNNPCPEGYRLPIRTEFETEIATWSEENAAGAFDSNLKLVAAGYREGNELYSGEILDEGNEGRYWSSTTSRNYSNYMIFGTTDVSAALVGGRANGLSVRCIKDESPCSATTLNSCYTQAECEAVGGYWYEAQCNSDPETNYGTVTSAGQVWMDRNLGASRVAQSYDDSEAYGDLYQWGRGTDGHEKRTSSTTTTLAVDTDSPGHGSFIYTYSSPGDWRSPQNDSLWQGVSGINNPCPAGFRLPTATELETERNSWISDNIDGAFSSPLKFVGASSRSIFDGEVIAAALGFTGTYWSSTVNQTSANGLFFNRTKAYVTSQARGYGSSVRCIQD